MSRRQMGLDVMRDRRAGATAVEFALVFPILMLIVIGFIEIAMVSNTHSQLRLACVAGARQASVHGATVDDVERKVSSFLTRLGINNHSISVSPREFEDASEISVTVKAPTSTIFFSSFYDGKMRYEVRRQFIFGKD